MTPEQIRAFFADNSASRGGITPWRDKCALEIMKVILAHPLGAQADKADAAREAYEYADAMLEARKK